MSIMFEPEIVLQNPPSDGSISSQSNHGVSILNDIFPQQRNPNISNAGITIPTNNSKNNSNQEPAQQEHSKKQSELTLEVYKGILTFNFVGKYDPKLKCIIRQTPYSVLYKFSTQNDEWEKLEFEGPLVFYERNVDPVEPQLAFPAPGQEQVVSERLKMKDNYVKGLMIINRNNPKNISLGIIPKSYSSAYHHFFRNSYYEVQMSNDLIILKNHLGEVYGIWIHDETDRNLFYNDALACINS